MFYVYALTDPRKDNQPFYIGKGKGKRATQHFYKCNLKERNFKNATIKAILNLGLKPGIDYLFEKLSEETAFSKEIELIKLYGRRDLGTGILANLTNGGDGAAGHIRTTVRLHTVETKRKMSISHLGMQNSLGRKNSKETNEKIRKFLIGKPSHALGYKWTTEQKKNLSKRRMGRVCPTQGKKRVYRENGTFYFA